MDDQNDVMLYSLYVTWAIGAPWLVAVIARDPEDALLDRRVFYVLHRAGRLEVLLYFVFDGQGF